MATKRPQNRSAGSKSRNAADDPRFIKLAQGQSKRDSIPIPTASDAWLPQTRSWYNSLSLSGQSEFYEASDWATAVCAAQAYDIFLRSHNASIFASFVRLSERLGATITDRKRSRIELEEPQPEDADEDAADAAVQGWQARLKVVRLWQATIRHSHGPLAGNSARASPHRLRSRLRSRSSAALRSRRKCTRPH
jgi:hypothetical protein